MACAQWHVLCKRKLNKFKKVGTVLFVGTVIVGLKLVGTILVGL